MFTTVKAVLTQVADEAVCGAALNEASLGADWLRDEEEAAWAHLPALAAAAGTNGR